MTVMEAMQRLGMQYFRARFTDHGGPYPLSEYVRQTKGIQDLFVVSHVLQNAPDGAEPDDFAWAIDAVSQGVMVERASKNSPYELILVISSSVTVVTGIGFGVINLFNRATAAWAQNAAARRDVSRSHLEREAYQILRRDLHVKASQQPRPNEAQQAQFQPDQIQDDTILRIVNRSIRTLAQLEMVEQVDERDV
jgi:hypothetical protein